MNQTIQESIRQLHGSLRDYIEAAYHISSPQLIAQRKELLDREGVISQAPYIESTPKYQTREKFSEIAGLHKAALEIYEILAQASGSQAALLYDPPYEHQSKSIKTSLVDGKNLLIMTGTGSGKTESFLLPILGKLAREAQGNPQSFREQPAMRALILYPMNALVNDQLGRLRSMFGDPRTVAKFNDWAGRPPRFARYTSRTPYAGMRTREKDSRKLKPFEEFYVDLQRKADGVASDAQARASNLRNQLKLKGKWPAKPDLAAWMGEKGTNWQNRKTGAFQRAVTLPNDTELLTRHEIQESPPDLLVTNYSMLEYMLMRPIERTIFDKTREWLTINPEEKFLVVLDEAHLYRGAAGAEVGLLLRRLRDRLGIQADRLQVICATASFKDKDYAPEFGAQLSGAPVKSFVPITGNLDLREGAEPGSEKDAKALSEIDLFRFYEATSDEARIEQIQKFLDYRKSTRGTSLEERLFYALEKFGPLSQLVNSTMKTALRVSELGAELFPDAPDIADAAVTALLALGSIARVDPKGAGLLPCRIHNFYRGLPGLWVCADPQCSEIKEDERSGICGKMYGQPRDVCSCGARVFEFFTCRFCGTAYARGYTDDVENPSALWSEQGQRMHLEGIDVDSLLPVDLLLEEPAQHEEVEPANLDVETGRVNPNIAGARTRTVYLRGNRLGEGADADGEVDTSYETRGQFIPCACCGESSRFGRSTVQDHQTKGDQPFQALVAKQIQIQPPNAVEASRFAPLRGRKVLVFSDSRQVAARLAPHLQMYSVRDSLRPLIAWGFRRLQNLAILHPLLSLEDLYLAVLLASKHLGVRLRPELKEGESFAAEDVVEAAVQDGSAATDSGLQFLWMRMKNERPPESLLEDIISTVQDKFLGLEALALVSICERSELKAALERLPPLPGLIETPEAKVALVRAWLRCWRGVGFWLNSMPAVWWQRPRTQGTSIRGQKGKFRAFDRILTERAHRKIFNDSWLPELLRTFTEDMAGTRRLRGMQLSLSLDGDWVRCESCKSVHRPVPNINQCLDCGSDAIRDLEPNTDEVFLARKGYYRNPVMGALSDPPEQPMALIAAEHTAQLNSPQNEDVFSKAEENELLFQDVPIETESDRVRATAIDVLSSTTTMEVGIDIGALSGVALRNMPPGRANYQQRAGRAGRRGNAVATVVAFGSADSHDDHYFTSPDGMIRGDVVDPKLTLENKEIARRHIRAFLLQCYHQERLPEVNPAQRHDLFSVLGSVASFKSTDAILNRTDFAAWLATNADALKARVGGWIPSELSPVDRKSLLDELVLDCIAELDKAINFAKTDTVKASEIEAVTDEDSVVEEAAETGEEQGPNLEASGNLLDRLLYCGVLPRYAFPTDVATFSVFDQARSTRYRPRMKFAPSQGLPIALSQYAPGKQIWISNKCYSSGAIYSTMPDDRFNAWENRRMYQECSQCGFARTQFLGQVGNGDLQDCEACGSENSFGPARQWLRPPGFAHPVDAPEVTSPDDMPETSYATRAKLTMETPSENANWLRINSRLRGLGARQHLLVSNTGPKREGYSYCLKCGRIEATSEATATLFGLHRKPFPDERDPTCDGTRTTRHLVLGTDFITDIVLFSLQVELPLQLKPGHYSTDVAMRSVSEALAKAACQMLEIEPGELMAEYRPALTPEGRLGLEAEIFLYDTLPGGAGFSVQLMDRGDELFRKARDLMEDCPEGCDASCYRCMRSFKNKFEHSLLDRHVGSELLRYILDGGKPKFNAKRIEDATTLLLNDLERQGQQAVSYEPNGNFELRTGKVLTTPILATVGGRQFSISLCGPLTPDVPNDPALRALSEEGENRQIIVVNELLVRRNLPAATRLVQERLGIYV
ncbi:DEAD/DEAH box helicase [Bradyrhizobium sp. G127]|uniref:DEAD/DEAH box helicase n=1 Tax=Bradyrhizobium sp. G127 TaxID=2904800 RepID=UPI001F4866FC|nr:DEAD/DEAH box helicase [Bradyrhizobium sp. G127]